VKVRVTGHRRFCLVTSFLRKRDLLFHVLTPTYFRLHPLLVLHLKPESYSCFAADQRSSPPDNSPPTAPSPLSRAPHKLPNEPIFRSNQHKLNHLYTYSNEPDYVRKPRS
jgi:hypothetical protein